MTQVSQKGSKTERGGDITIHRGGKKQLASGCVSSCRQVDAESNKDTNNCQGVEKRQSERWRRRGKGRSEQERDQETEGDRECFSSEQNVVIYLVAAKQIRRLPVLWLSQWGAVRFRRISSLSVQQTLNTPAVLSLLSQHAHQTFSKCFFFFFLVCFHIPQCPSRCSSSFPFTFCPACRQTVKKQLIKDKNSPLNINHHLNLQVFIVVNARNKGAISKERL